MDASVPTGGTGIYMAGSDDGGGRGRRRGVAADQLRRHNLSAVLERLHLSGPMSRSELAATTGLNRSTIGDLIGELARLGLVEEPPDLPTATGPGRPSAVVQTRPQGAAVLAIEFAVDSVAVATIGLGGHVYNRLRIARPRGRFSAEETVQNLAQLAGPLLDALPTSHVLVGIGASVVAVVRRSDGFVHLAPHLGWRDVPLTRLLRSELDLECPIVVGNEADLGALAELRRGPRAGVDHLVYVSGEVGIGCGIVVDGKPLLGAAGYAGEAGHTLVNAEGRECPCGATGCWETEAGETPLLRLAGLTAGTDHIEELATRAAAGDPTTLAAVSEVGRWLGVGIGNLINLFNPERIVLGGLYHRLYPYLEASVVEAAGKVALRAPGEQATIGRSALGPDAHLLGAAELAFSSVLADPAGLDGRSAHPRDATAAPRP